MPKTTLPSIADIKKRFSEVSFKTSEDFYWSARDNCVYYNEKQITDEPGLFQLIHEIGHALCGHQRFESGVQLLKMEAEAWAKARQIAEEFELSIPEELIEHCLDSYRDWLHLRSACPTCTTTAVETEPFLYHCFNCYQNWRVPTDQRTRRYRSKLAIGNK